MGSMLKQLWNMLAAIFAAGEVLGLAAQKGAQSLDHLGSWCEETAGSFADRAREERKQALAILQSTQARSAQANGMPLLTGNTDTSTTTTA